MDKYIGRLLDNRYEILEVIGTGGMAVVYKARCHRLNRLVAIKILKDDFLEDEDFRRRFHAESQAVAMLSHPNIVSVYDVSTSISMEADYIVMELIEGISLKQYMEKKGVLNWKETLHFAMQIAKALEHAHSRGVVHRDIKPHNVMVLKNGSVKVADFGIARMMSKGDTLTKEALGSVHYISPEQAKGGRVDNRSDIYSLGVVMYEMMTGRPPYEGDSPVAVAIQHINGGAIMPSALNPNIPGGMEQIIMKAMAHDLKDRYTTATQMLADMDEFRKDPTLLFDYNTPALDAVTRLNRKQPVPENGGRSTADRVEEKAETHRKTRQAQREAQLAEERKRKEAAQGQGSRVATVAIIVCSLVTVVAIAVFLLLLLSGGLNAQPKPVEIPNLVGKYYDALPEYTGITIYDSGNWVYDDEYDEGQIIKQNPEGGTTMPFGTTVYVTISKGQEEAPIPMPNLIKMTQDQAMEQLNNLSLDLNVEIDEAYDEKLPAGKVILTAPAEGAILSVGQTVTLTVSLGTPPVGEGMVTGLVGLKLDMAINILTANGFASPEYEQVYSNEEVGIVVSQSVEKGDKVPFDTVIFLEVSKGPEPTTEPPTEETTESDEPQMVVKNVVIDLRDKVEAEGSLVTVVREGVEVYTGVIDPENPVITLTGQIGSGTVTYEVYINSSENPVFTEEVPFTTDG